MYPSRPHDSPALHIMYDVYQQQKQQLKRAGRPSILAICLLFLSRAERRIKGLARMFRAVSFGTDDAFHDGYHRSCSLSTGVRPPASIPATTFDGKLATWPVNDRDSTLPTSLWRGFFSPLPRSFFFSLFSLNSSSKWNSKKQAVSARSRNDFAIRRRSFLYSLRDRRGVSRGSTDYGTDRESGGGWKRDRRLKRDRGRVATRWR